MADDKHPNGLPDALKRGVEALSGMSLYDVKVHRGSAKPAQLNAHAYAQGSDIHLAPGQEPHLPHEAWHVVQQQQGRVRPTMQMKNGAEINDEAALEQEADMMGMRALSRDETPSSEPAFQRVSRATTSTIRSPDSSRPLSASQKPKTRSPR